MDLCRLNDFHSALRVSQALGDKASAMTFHPIVMGLSAQGDYGRVQDVLRSAVAMGVHPTAEMVAAGRKKETSSISTKKS